MKFYPFLLSLIIWGISYHGIYALTNQFWAEPDSYCRINASPQQFNACTKSVAINGFLNLLIPLGISIGTYVIASSIQKKRKEITINEY